MKQYFRVALLSILASITTFAQLKPIQFENLVKDGVPIKATGVLVDANGTFATVVLHQANPAKASVKDADGKSVELELLAHDAISRMTLYKLPKELQNDALEVKDFASISKLNIGDPLIADVKQQEKTSLLVSFVRKFSGRTLPVTFIRANTKGQEITPGSPIFNKAKELVGLAYQPSLDKGSFYILPAKVITHLQASAKFGKKFKPCWIGVSMEDLNDAPTILGVRPETPAKRAGLQKGDIVISIAGVAVTNYPEVVNAFYYLLRDQPTKFKIIRGVEVKELTVTPEVNPIFK